MPPSTLMLSKRWFVILFFCVTLILAIGCSAGQWPAHPLPAHISEVAAYGRVIKLRPSFDRCLEDAEGETPCILDCMDAEHAYQDSRLNKVYKDLMASLGGVERLNLRNEEREWMAFRDKFCFLDSESGQGGQIDHAECLVDQTVDRSTELESRLHKDNEFHL